MTWTEQVFVLACLIVAAGVVSWMVAELEARSK